MGCDMVVSRYVIPKGIPYVDGLLTGPSGFGVSQVILEKCDEFLLHKEIKDFLSLCHIKSILYLCIRGSRLLSHNSPHGSKFPWRSFFVDFRP